MKAWKRVVSALCFTLPLLVTTIAESAGRRVVVRTVTPGDEAILERIVGQTSELTPDLERSISTTLEPGVGARLEAARALARRFSADLVVWFEHPSADEAVVFVDFPKEQRVLVRHVGGASGPAPASTSAGFEAAAFVVRTALLALESDVAVGVPEETLTNDPSTSPRPREVPPAPAIPPPTSPSPRRSPSASPSRPEPRWRARAAAGWQLAVDGQSPVGERALVGELGAAYGSWGFGVRGELGLPSRFHDDLASFEVTRSSASMFVTKTVLRDKSLRVDAALGAGASVLERLALRRTGTFQPAPEQTTTAVVGRIDLRLLWIPRAPRAVGLAAVFGVEAFSESPILLYSDGRRELRRPFWPVQLLVGFLVAFDTP